jgi:hypothetical protein
MYDNNLVPYRDGVYCMLRVPEHKARYVLEVSMFSVHPSRPDHVLMSCVEIQNAALILGLVSES